MPSRVPGTSSFDSSSSKPTGGGDLRGRRRDVAGPAGSGRHAGNYPTGRAARHGTWSASATRITRCG